MDDQLATIIAMLYKQNETLGRARFNYLDRESERKYFEAKLVQGFLGKSHAESLSRAQGSPEWFDFHKGLAKLESIFEFEKLKFQVLEKEFLAIHLTLKLDAETIRRG